MRTAWNCLMYHDITPGVARSGGGPMRFAVPYEEFQRQLDQLRSEGYEGRSLRTAIGEPSNRPIAITFDDGNASQHELALRALVSRGMTATFFVTTEWIGRPGFLSWDQLREMREAGMDIQSHGRSHRFLSELRQPELDWELRGSKEDLDSHLDQDTDMLALPGGDWPRTSLRHRIADAGYRVVATSRWGTNRRAPGESGIPFPVCRCTVRGSPSGEAFGRIVTGDAWLSFRRRLRESLLGTMRTALGPSRYASWRRVFLDTVSP